MTPESFSKGNRLLSKDDFTYLKSGSTSVRAKLMMAFYKDSKINGGKSRLGISASKKVGNAVKRNRVKRHIREYFRKSRNMDLGKDLLVVVHPKFYSDTTNEINDKVEQSLGMIFKRITSNENIS
jgi:ribonuclease P protein component